MKVYGILIVTLILISNLINAAPYKRNFRDMKLPTQVMLESQTISTPAAAESNEIISGWAGAGDAGATILYSTDADFGSQPDVPRTVSITPHGTTNDVSTCEVYITGTDFHDAAIAETVSFADNQTDAETTTRAFKTVTSLSLPTSCEDGTFAATWNMGYGAALGMKRCMTYTGDLVYSMFDGAYESTRGTAAVGSSVEVSYNTFTPNGSPDGTKDVIIRFIQNFQPACFP